jgi:hypothetical protein
VSTADFYQQMLKLTKQLSTQPLNHSLEDWLNANMGSSTDTFRQLRDACLRGIDEGWLCNRHAQGIAYGRVFKSNNELNNFSVDVVKMTDIVGPQHSHPNGEIDLIMPLDESALFDNRSAGWLVYPENTSHKPTVSLGSAVVLYLLPHGAIEFSK